MLLDPFGYKLGITAQPTQATFIIQHDLVKN